MSGLFAVEPLGIGAVDRDRVRGDVARAGVHGLVIRVGTAGHGLARRGERRLCDGVVLGVEDERDRVAGGGGKRRGREREAAVADLDLVVCCRDGGGKGGEDEGSDVEMHL